MARFVIKYLALQNDESLSKRIRQVTKIGSQFCQILNGMDKHFLKFSQSGEISSNLGTLAENETSGKSVKGTIRENFVYQPTHFFIVTSSSNAIQRRFRVALLQSHATSPFCFLNAALSRGFPISPSYRDVTGRRRCRRHQRRRAYINVVRAFDSKFSLQRSVHLRRQENRFQFKHNNVSF